MISQANIGRQQKLKTQNWLDPISSFIIESTMLSHYRGYNVQMFMDADIIYMDNLLYVVLCTLQGNIDA